MICIFPSNFNMPSFLTLCFIRLPTNSTSYDVREEPKVIVFIKQLLLLFKTCHLCSANEPSINVILRGTLVTITSSCTDCKQQFVWKSQPLMLDRYYAGNLLLSFSILCAGSSIRKTLLVFKHMGVCVYRESAFYRHQRHLLTPSIVKFWRSYQDKTFKSLEGREVVLSGDGRHDSMGHSAKYGTYTIFCCTDGLILHLVLVQVC